MAFDYGDLGNGNGYIYEAKASGVIETFTNSPDHIASLKLRGIKARKLAMPDFIANGYTLGFNDPAGSQFYFNAEVAAPKNSIAGALEITQDIIQPDFNVLDVKTIVTDILDIERVSNIMTIAMNPESGNSDTLNEITFTDRSFVTGDILILYANGPTDAITVNDNGVSAGNIKLAYGRNCLLIGDNTLMLQKDGTGWREVCRTIDSHTSYAQKTIVAGGGTWNVLDPSNPAAEYVSTRDGMVLVSGSVTLVANYTVQAEAVITTRSQGQRLTIIGSGAVVLNGNKYTVMGIELPANLAKTGAWMVEAVFNGSAYVARLIKTKYDPAYVNLSSVAGLVTGANVNANNVQFIELIDSTLTGNLIKMRGSVTIDPAAASGVNPTVLFTTLPDYLTPLTANVRGMVAVFNGIATWASAQIEITTAGAINLYVTSALDPIPVGSIVYFDIIYPAKQSA